MPGAGVYQFLSVGLRLDTGVLLASFPGRLPTL